MPIVTNTEYKIKGKKRQRANVPHKPLCAETKVFWPINTANNPESDTTYATWMPHAKMYETEQDSYGHGHMYSYMIKPLLWPAVGPGSHQRIGNKITSKLMRFKGSFNVYYTLPRPIRVRLYYFYYKAHSFANADLNVTKIKDYSNVITWGTSSANSFNYALTNYYDAQWRDAYINTPEFFKTKIGEWYIKPYSPILAPGQLISGRQHEVGESGNVVEGVSWTMANCGNTLAYAIPFDKTVYLNQEILCNGDAHYLYWESDGVTGLICKNAMYFGDSLAPNHDTPIEGFINKEPSVVCQFKLFYYFQE